MKKYIGELKQHPEALFILGYMLFPLLALVVAVLGFFGELYNENSSHFALEERFMREKGYDQLSQHKGDHERLLDEIRDIMEDYEVNDLFEERLLAQRLDAWFSRHFESHDARLHRALGDH